MSADTGCQNCIGMIERGCYCAAMGGHPGGPLIEMDEALTLDGEKLRQLTGEDHGPWTAQDDDRDYALATVRQALNDDSVAATMVAATINTRQAAGESGPAFVKRIVRSWLEEMGR